MEEDLKKNGKRPKKKMKETYFLKTRMMTSKKWNTTSKNNLKNGKRPQNKNGKKWKTTSKKKEDKPINLIGCDTIVNSPSLYYCWTISIGWGLFMQAIFQQIK